MVARTEKYAELEIGLYRSANGRYQAELRFTDPGNESEREPVKGPAPIDLEALRALQTDSRAYGQALTEQLFDDRDVRDFYRKVEVVVQAVGHLLRLRLLVDPKAPELHELRWELLRDPDSNSPLATSEKVLLSRFMVSRDWRHVRPRPLAELKALIAVAAPSDAVANYNLAEVSREREIRCVESNLGEVPRQAMPAPVTLRCLDERLRAGVDVLYLVCHGGWSHDGEGKALALLYLEDDEGHTRPVRAQALAERVAELERPPLLAVLASCESGAMEGGAGGAEASAHSSLAQLLADAGVPAIVAMQGRISMATTEGLMPVFFEKLLEDGQIDRAMAIARGAVRDRPDSWMPALYLRLKGGRLWSDAGFGGGDEVKWKNLCRHVRGGRFLPILGPRLTERVYLAASETARRLAEYHHMPLAEHSCGDLPRVLQYLSVKEKPSAVLPELKEQLYRQMLEMYGGLLPDELRGAKLPELMDAVGKLRRQQPDEPHRMLAELRAPIYVTTNYDNLLYRALQEQGCEPQRLVCSWRSDPPITGRFDGEPTEQRPAVYHALGFFGKKESLVLTEDDYFDFLIAHTPENRLVPPLVEKSMVHRSLLLLGFRPTDWSFRVLFRLIMNLPGRRQLKEHPHVAVQIDPGEAEFADAAGARDYLENFFDVAARIDVYWGSAEDFLEELHRKLATLPAEDSAVAEEKPSEWD